MLNLIFRIISWFIYDGIAFTFFLLAIDFLSYGFVEVAVGYAVLIPFAYKSTRGSTF